MKAKLGILSTHPIQYYAPLFRFLAGVEDLDLRVYYCLKPTPEQQGTGFGISFTWDLDITSGYNITWLDNIAGNPHLQKFSGCDTPGIMEIVGRERFDAFLTFGWYTKSMWQAMRACWRTGTPLMVRGDSHLHVDSGLMKRTIKEIAYPLFMKRFAVCLAVGAWSEEYFVHYGAPCVVRSPHFVDNARFATESANCRREADTIRSLWGIPVEKTVFLFSGKFEEKKRPLDLLRALRVLMERGKGRSMAHLLMVGDGILRRECEMYAREHGLPASFAGFLNQGEMPKAYAIADVLVLPSDGRETWGLTVNEAMACGLPAIVSDRVGCGPDLVRDGETGYLFRCGDCEELATRMSHMVERDVSGVMGENAARLIGNYSVETAAEGILQALKVVGHDQR